MSGASDLRASGAHEDKVENTGSKVNLVYSTREADIMKEVFVALLKNPQTYDRFCFLFVLFHCICASLVSRVGARAVCYNC